MTTRAMLGALHFSWISDLPASAWYGVLAICVAVWLLLRLGWGRSLVRQKKGLLVLRAVAVAMAIGIALGPTLVDEIPGETSRAAIVYLFDGSQSMLLGNDQTRWQQCLDFRADAEQKAGAASAGEARAFRFGHRLMPLGAGQQSSQGSPITDNSISAPVTQVVSGAAAGHVQATPPEAATLIAPPDAGDTRLADALRQLSQQVDSQNTAGVVLLSDGRVRATDSVEGLAERFGAAGVPIHVVPVGESVGTGDVAIVSLVAEPRVRKFTENQLTLFLRSFGFTGKRTVVRILGNGRIAGAGPTTLAELPVTLSGGAQSVSLTYRMEDRSQDLTVVVDSLEGELTDRNNRVQTHVDIDRTKLRVLYIEGDSGAGATFLQSLLTLGQRTATPAPQALNVRDALQVDEDIECVVLINEGIGQFRRASTSSNASTGFPQSRAELFAYDCVVLSNVAPHVLREEELSQLAMWLEGRGGGLVVTGSTSLRKASWSEDNPLTALLPVNLAQFEEQAAQPTVVRPAQSDHPVWRLRLEEAPNTLLLDQLPPLSVGATGMLVKTDAEVLAHTASQQPVIVAHRVGRGRVLVSSADLGSRSIADLGMNWGPQPERVASKLWRNIVYWATEGSSVGRRRLVAESDKRFYRPGESIEIRSTAFDEAARKTGKVRVWAMFEPMSLDDPSIYSPVLWPDNVVRESGESGPRVAWGEELPLTFNALDNQYVAQLMLSEMAGSGDSGLRIELTVYDGDDSESSGGHGTQVDSTSLTIHVLSDPFEQQNPLPNRELLARVASLSGGQVLERPDDLARILSQREITQAAPQQDLTPAWSRAWLWFCFLGLLTVEWIWRRTSGFA